jgi:hypothetical protein
LLYDQIFHKFGVGIQVFPRGNFLLKGNLNAGIGIICNVNYKQQQVMIKIMGFLDAEKKLFFKLIHGTVTTLKKGVQEL